MWRKSAISYLLWLIFVGLITSCATSEDRVAVGREIFNQSCAGCHSVDPNAPAMEGPTLAYLFSVRDLRKFLSNGRELNIQNLKVLITIGYEDMPGTALEPDEMDALVEYLLSVSQQEQP
jgi:mono/diheme cytochrome c family protein